MTLKVNRGVVLKPPDSHKDKSFMEFVNPNSLKTVNAFVEPYLQKAKLGTHFQFQRLGYFTLDLDSTSENLVFNKTVGLRDSWAKQKPKPQQNQSQKPQNSNAGHAKNPMGEIQKLGKK